MLCFLVSEQSYTENQQELHSINMVAGPSQSALGVGSAGPRSEASCGEGVSVWAGLARLGHCSTAVGEAPVGEDFGSCLLLEVQVDFLSSFQVHSHL